MIFASCRQDDYKELGLSDNDKYENGYFTIPFYGIKQPPISQTKAVAQINKLWDPSDVITYKFLNGSSNDQEIVDDAIAEWLEYANLEFKKVSIGNADVRIGFDYDYNKWITWSYTGKDCQLIANQLDATANFAGWTGPYAKLSAQKRIDALRLIGQVLGLELEYRHAGFDPGWANINRVQRYWEGEIEDIPWNILSTYVFDPLNALMVEQTTNYDSESIMNWPFYSQMGNNIDNYCYGITDLSDQDIEFIKRIYPPILLIEADFLYKDSQIPEISINNQFPISIDWGDDILVEYAAGSNFYTNGSRPIQYTNGQVYTLKIYGSRESLTVLRMKCCGLTNFNVYENRELYMLDCRYNFINSLDVSTLPKLISLEISGNSISGISLSNNPLLDSFSSDYNHLETLNFSNNTKITHITLDGNYGSGELGDNLLSISNMIASLPNPTNYIIPQRGTIWFSVSSNLSSQLTAITNAFASKGWDLWGSNQPCSWCSICHQ